MSALNEFETALRALRVMREQKLREVEQIDLNIANFTTLMHSLPEMKERLAALGEATDRYAHLSIPKAAASYLQEVAKQPAVTRDIAEALLRGGIKTSAKSFEATVYSLLRESTSPRFRRTPDGRAWWLQDVLLPNEDWGLEGQTPPPPKTRNRAKR
jgi:hypothetical protein